jgi:hypothetical protein
MSVVATVKGKICEEYERSKLAGIFHGETFGFPQLLPAWLLYGDLGLGFTGANTVVDNNLVISDVVIVFGTYKPTIAHRRRGGRTEHERQCGSRLVVHPCHRNIPIIFDLHFPLPILFFRQSFYFS